MSGQWPPEWEDQDDVFPEDTDQTDTEAGARLSELAAYLVSVPAPVLPDAIESRISAALAAALSVEIRSDPATRCGSGVPCKRLAQTSGIPSATTRFASETRTEKLISCRQRRR